MTAAVAPRVILNAPQIKITAAYGRLYVTGIHAHLLRGLPGAVADERRAQTYMVSLTLETLRAIRQTLGVTKQQMASYCTPEVMRWARAAGEQERRLLDIHRRLATGWRAELPWTDTRAGTPAPAGAPADKTYDANGVVVWLPRVAYDHQKVMASVALELDGCAFLCEMGTGKTRAAVEVMRAKLARGEIKYVVVVCPRGVINTWCREVAQWAPDLRALRLTGSLNARRQFLQQLATGRIRTPYNVFVTNYEGLAAIQPALTQLCGAAPVMVTLDEMHKIKNPQAQTTQAAMKLAGAARARLGMTGTPIANGAEDIWSQWYFIDLGITFGANFVQFRREFFHEYDWSWTRDPVEGGLDQIGQRLRLRGLRFRKEDCLDLPPKVYEVIEVEMAPDQRRAYEEMQEQLVAWLRDGAPMGEMAADPDDPNQDPIEDVEEGRRASAANQLVAIMRLTQITSGFVPSETGEVHRFQPNPKLDACEELVRDNVRGGRSVIVWAAYRHDITALLERLADLNPVRIDGSQQGVRGQGDRDEAERRFQAGETKVLIGNPAAGGVGLNLQAASVAIYYSQTYNLIYRYQSEDRCHRSGSEIHNRVTYYDLSCVDSIDETVRAGLSGKKELADIVVDLRRAIGA